MEKFYKIFVNQTLYLKCKIWYKFDVILLSKNTYGDIVIIRDVSKYSRDV